jgi:hypothetical protein
MRPHPIPVLRPRAFVLAAFALAATGCDDGGHEHCDECGGPPPPPLYYELEPNDSPFTPDRIGVVDAFTLLYVDGHVQAVGHDIVDHLEFLSATPATYDFRLDALSPFGDVDVLVYDPIADVVVGVFETSGSVELGRVIVHQPDRPFQLIIEAYLLDTAWSLELVGGFYSGLARAAGGPLGYDVSPLDDAEGLERLSPIEVVLIGGDARE